MNFVIRQIHANTSRISTIPTKEILKVKLGKDMGKFKYNRSVEFSGGLTKVTITKIKKCIYSGSKVVDATCDCHMAEKKSHLFLLQMC